MRTRLQFRGVVWALVLPLAVVAAGIGLCDEPQSGGADARAAATAGTAASAQADGGPTSLASGGIFDAAAFSPDGARLLTRFGRLKLQLWEMPAGHVVQRRFDAPFAEETTAFAWGPDGTRIAAGSAVSEGLLMSSSAYVAVWDTASGNLVQRCNIQVPDRVGAYYVYHIQFTPDGKRLCAVVEAAAKCGARIWDAASGKELLRIDDLAGAADCAQFSADGGRIFVPHRSRGEGAAVVRDANTGKEICRFDPKGNGTLTCSAISPDGTRIATAAFRAGNVVKIWDAATGREMRTLKGHTDELWSVAFTPDGQRVVTGSADNTARTWDAGTGQELKRLNRQDGVHSAIPDADGRRIHVQWWVGGEAQPRHSIWTPDTGQVDDAPAGAEVLGFGPDSHWYLVVERGQRAKEWPHKRGPSVATLYDTRTGKAVRTYK